MEIKDNKITFTSDGKTIDSFRLALNLLDKDPDQAFEEWVRNLTFIALRRAGGKNDMLYSSSETATLRSHFSERLDNDVVQARIQRWARNKTGFAYKMLNIFFLLYNRSNDHNVKRKDMESYYLNDPIIYNKEHTINPFIITFRQMCSDSRRAYGLIFKYINDNGEDEVILHPINADYILNLAEEFK